MSSTLKFNSGFYRMIQKTLSILLVIVALCSCNRPPEQRVDIVKFDELQKLMTRSESKLEVINFWATWCKPCIEELPYFESLYKQRREELNVTLISLDFADQFEKRVIPFVNEKGLSPDVLLLDEIDYNSWIDKVDPSWTGAIPATLVINHKTGQRKFVEKELEEGEIESIIDELVN